MKLRQLLIILLVLITFMRIQQAHWYIKTDYTLTYKKIWGWELTQDLVQYAYDVSSWNLDFIHTIECENWMREPLRQSNVVNEKWQRETSYWLCQRNTIWFSDIVNDQNFSDPYWQIDKCLEMYNGWQSIGILENRLYWYNNRSQCATHFEWEIEINYYLQPRNGNQWLRKKMATYTNHRLSR